MAKFKDVENKIDEALKLSKESGKEYGFNICLSGDEITTTNIEERDRNFISSENKCPETKLGSVHVHPESKDAIPSPESVEMVKP